KTYPPLEFNWTPKYPYIPSVPSLTGTIIANAQRFIASLNQADVKDLGQNLNKLVVNLNAKLDKVPVAEISTELEVALKSARRTIDGVDRVVAGAPIDETVQKLASASARLDKLLADPGLQQTVGNVASFTEHLRKIGESGELDRVVRNIDEAVQRLDGMLGDNQYDVRTILQDLRVTASNLRTLSETVKRYPAGALRGGPPEKAGLPRDPKWIYPPPLSCSAPRGPSPPARSASRCPRRRPMSSSCPRPRPPRRAAPRRFGWPTFAWRPRSRGTRSSTAWTRCGIPPIRTTFSSLTPPSCSGTAWPNGSTARGHSSPSSSPTARAGRPTSSRRP